MSVRVRFAPSPTGSLHLGNALTAAANRRFADGHGGRLVLRIDDTDPARTAPGGEEAIRADLEWLGIHADEGPVRQSERSALYAAAIVRALAGGAVEDDTGAVRLGPTTLARPDGSATYQLATVVDDLDLRITHVIRGGDHRPNEEVHRRIAEALGGGYPTVVHHGLLLGGDGKKLSKRHGAASLSELREAGIPAPAIMAYLDELGLPSHDVRFDERRLRRLATDAIAAMPDGDLAAAAGAPLEAVPALRGARTFAEARFWAAQLADEPEPGSAVDATPTLARFAELRTAGPERLEHADAREIVRELKAAGGDLRSLRRALTGAASGPELSAVLEALPRDVALRRAAAGALG